MSTPFKQSARWSKDKPPSLQQFLAMFLDDSACAEYLAKKR
jgi:hypothetical protein